ncbi:MAG: VanZ family protein [Gemmatimonadota bacterium]|nr:MAG: VanZ family protein [Gemmatimonadota bacterium]
MPSTAGNASGTTRVRAARLAYIGVLALATLVPFRADPDFAAVAERLIRAFQPVVSARDAVDAVRNVALFAGWGALWMATSAVARARSAIAQATLTGVLLSLGIETLQLFSAARNASALDLLTNSGGALLGSVTIALLTEAVRGARGRRSFVGMPAFLFAGAYGCAAFLEALLPLFRSEPLPGVYGGPLSRFGAVLDSFSAESLFAIPVLDILIFIPVGALAVAALVELGWSYAAAARSTAVGGLALAVGAEIGHGFFGQTIELGAIVIHAAAIAAGAWAARAYIPKLTRILRGPNRPLALAFAYAALLIVWAWRPFLPELNLATIAEQFSITRWIPLASHAPRVDLFSVSDVIASFLLYLPAGALLAVWPLRRQGALRGFLPALELAMVLELGQILVAERFFDITDVLVAAAGAAIGWTVVRQAGFRPYGESLVRARADAGPRPARRHRDA